MRKILCIAAVLVSLLMCGCEKNIEYTKNIFAMDTIMDLKIYADSEEALWESEAEIKRIDALLDRENQESEIYRINKNKSDNISSETADIIRKALSVSERTDGAFDITIAPIMDLWGFYGSEFKVPSDIELYDTLKKVGYKKIKLGNNNISMSDDTSIDLGGIGKGYTSDRIVSILKNNGVKSAIISLGGNVHAMGKRPDNRAWTVGIQDPNDKTQIIGKLEVTDKAVITSGGYQRYFEQAGVTYHHIIDPNTGKSANSGLTSVTVISNSGITADALSTALFVMGLEKSIQLWRQSSDFDAVFIDDTGKIYITDGIADRFKCDFDFTTVYK